MIWDEQVLWAGLILSSLLAFVTIACSGWQFYQGWRSRQRAIKDFQRGLKSGTYRIPKEDDPIV